ncbi:hypothetical protein ABZ079_35705 [Streptomyces sp. NPDC006314]
MSTVQRRRATDPREAPVTRGTAADGMNATATAEYEIAVREGGPA